MIRHVHRLLLRLLLPATLRDRHGADMEALFLEVHADAAARGPGAVLGVWLRETLDLAVTGWRLRRRARVSGTTVGRSRLGRAAPAVGAGYGPAPARRSGLVDDLRYALRSLARRPAFTGFAALTVGLGVGATTAIFSTVEGVVLRPVEYRDADRMASLFRRVGPTGWLVPTAEQIADLSAQTDLVEAVEPWSVRFRTLTGAGDAREVTTGMVRPSFHRLVGRDPVLGRAFSAEEMAGDGGRVALLSHALWVERFGADRSVLGRAVTLDGEPWTVIGIMPERTVLVVWGTLNVDVWTPLPDRVAARPSSVTVLLQDGVEAGAVNARLADVAARDGRASAGDGSAEVLMVRELVGFGFGDTLTALSVAVVLLLLISCANVANLLLVRATARRRETAVRTALGAGRGRLVRQLLVESVALALLGGAVGLAIAYGGQRAILALRPAELSALDGVALDGTVLLFALGLAAATGLLFGLVPALQATREGALEPLRGGHRVGGDLAGGRFAWGLVSSEVGLSFALLLGSLLVLGSLARLSRADVGFRADEVLVLEVTLPRWKIDEPAEGAALFARIVEGVRALPGVTDVAQATGLPTLAGRFFGTVSVDDAEAGEETWTVRTPNIDASYFRTLGQPIVAGRALREDEVADGVAVAVVGESMARRFFAGGDAVGHRVRLGDGEWHTVVGVAGDVPMDGLASADPALTLYTPLQDGFGRRIAIRTATGLGVAELGAPIRRVVTDLDDAIRIDGLSMADTHLRASLNRERFTFRIVGAFAGVALLLAAVGLYGVLAHVVGLRVREIGVRMALGATRTSVRALVLRRAAVATAWGIAAGVVLAASGIAALRSRLFGLEGASVAWYVATAAMLVATAGVTAYLPARRASRVDPVEAMRAD